MLRFYKNVVKLNFLSTFCSLRQNKLIAKRVSPIVHVFLLVFRISSDFRDRCFSVVPNYAFIVRLWTRPVFYTFRIRKSLTFAGIGEVTNRLRLLVSLENYV